MADAPRSRTYNDKIYNLASGFLHKKAACNYAAHLRRQGFRARAVFLPEYSKEYWWVYFRKEGI